MAYLHRMEIPEQIDYLLKFFTVEEVMGHLNIIEVIDGKCDCPHCKRKCSVKKIKKDAFSSVVCRCGWRVSLNPLKGK